MKCPLTSELLPPHHFSHTPLHIRRIFFHDVILQSGKLHAMVSITSPFRLMFTETSLGFAVTRKDVSMPLLLGMGRAFAVCVRNTMRFVMHARRGGMAWRSVMNCDALSFCILVANNTKESQMQRGKNVHKSQQHPEVFPGGPPPQY